MNIRKIIREVLEENDTDVKYPEIPKLVYHGQPPKYVNGERQEPIKFDKFNIDDKRFLKSDNHGFYFTDDKMEAADYAEGGNIYTCTLDIKNPYYYEDIYNYNNKGLIRSGNFIDTSNLEKLVSNGYDGVVLLTAMNKVGEIIALYPEQIEIISVD